MNITFVKSRKRLTVLLISIVFIVTNVLTFASVASAEEQVANPSVAVIKITCDSSYDLYVNGTAVGSGTNWQDAETYSVNLQVGKNVIAVSAKDDLLGDAGLAAKIDVDGKTYYTGNDWRISMFSYNDWNKVNYNDSFWGYATKYLNPNISGEPSYIQNMGYCSYWIWDKYSRTTSCFFRYTINISPKPVASWNFENTSGNAIKTEKDISGNNLDAFCLGGAKKVDFLGGKALNFTGSNYMLVADNELLNFRRSQNFSIALWFNSSSKKAINTILDKRSSSYVGYHCCLYNGQMLFQMGSSDTASYQNFYGGPSLNDGNWHHLVISVDRYNTSGLNFYIDGKLIYTGNPTKFSTSTANISNTSNLLIGKHMSSSSSNFVGNMDEINIYRFALTPEWIKILFNEG